MPLRAIWLLPIDMGRVDMEHVDMGQVAGPVVIGCGVGLLFFPEGCHGAPHTITQNAMI